MKDALLAATAALGLALPAAAQTTQPMDRTQQQMMMDQRQGGAISPSQLSADQIRQLQQRLQDQGYSITRIDGIWGPETAGAVRSFEQQQGGGTAGSLAAGGIDPRTLSQLGVSMPGAYGGQQTTPPAGGTRMPDSGTGMPGAMTPERTPGSSGGSQGGPGTPGGTGTPGSGTGVGR